MTIFNAAADVIYADDNIASDAVYTPVSASPRQVRVIIEHDVDVIAMAQSDLADRVTVINIRKSDVENPIAGDTVIVGASTYTVDVVIEDDQIESRVAVK